MKKSVIFGLSILLAHFYMYASEGGIPERVPTSDEEEQIFFQHFPKQLDQLKERCDKPYSWTCLRESKKLTEQLLKYQSSPHMPQGTKIFPAGGFCKGQWENVVVQQPNVEFVIGMNENQDKVKIVKNSISIYEYNPGSMRRWVEQNPYKAAGCGLAAIASCFAIKKGIGHYKKFVGSSAIMSVQKR